MYVRQERQRTMVLEVITGSCCRREEEKKHVRKSTFLLGRGQVSVDTCRSLNGWRRRPRGSLALLRRA